MKHLAVPYVFGSKSQVEFEITDLDQMEERLRKSGFIDPGNNHQRFLYVIAFAVMTAGDHVLVVEKSSGERVLGFGKPITWRPDIVGYNRRSFILQTLYDELDLYVPGSSYDIYQVALIHDAEHEYASLGCVFFKKLPVIYFLFPVFQSPSLIHPAMKTGPRCPSQYYYWPHPSRQRSFQTAWCPQDKGYQKPCRLCRQAGPSAPFLLLPYRTFGVPFSLSPSGFGNYPFFP